MRPKANNKGQNEKGEAMLITTILLLVMIVIVGAAMNVADMQWDMAFMQKNTSNTYYLAKSGAKKGTDVINKALQAQIPTFVQEIRAAYLKPVTLIDDVRAIAGENTSDFYTTKHLQYEINEPLKDNKFLIDKKVVADILKDKIYNFLLDKYFNQSINYEVKGDGQTDAVATQITIEFKDSSPVNKSTFKIKCIAKTADGKDIKTVEATVKIEVPDEIDNEIHEAYNWLYNPPEVLDSAITCFSDVVITNDANLTVIGDIRVKGTSKQTTLATRDTEIILVAPDMDEMGGIIASNGGILDVRSPQSPSSTIAVVKPAEAYYGNRNVIISYRKSILAPASVASKTTDANYTTNTGSIYCINNVATTHGWEPEAEENPSNSNQENYKRTTSAAITAQGDIIANTLGIYDDLYKGGYNQTPFGGVAVPSGNTIKVTGNVFVDNDVEIDKYVTSSNIIVSGSIFGISDGTLGPKLVTETREYKDPNSSSGIFNRATSSLIKANGIFVNGQPFIDLGKGVFYALWESIGEPFEDVKFFPGYKEDIPDLVGNPSYLESSSHLYENIKKNQVIISEADKIYIPEGNYVSANGLTRTYVNSYLSNKEEARKLFYLGDSGKSVRDLTGNENDLKYNGITEMFGAANKYYKAEYSAEDVSQLYYKKYTSDPSDITETDPTEKYRGLRGYMTAKRSVFYGSFNAVTSGPTLLTFNDVVGDLSEISKLTKDWSYSTPVEVVDGGTINIDKYYVNDGENGAVGNRPYPTVIINTHSNPSKPLILIGGSNLAETKTFKGLIISQGNVEIQGYMTIEGSIIIGGNSPVGDASRVEGTGTGTGLTARDKMMLGKEVGLKLSGAGTEVTIIHNPDMLLQMSFSDKKLFRSLLDALKTTQFEGNTDVAAILGPYNSGKIAYTQGRVKISNQSVLDLTTFNTTTATLKVKIKNMKKINE